MMAMHSAVQRTFLNEAGKTVRLNRSLHVLSFTLLIPNFFSIPDTIYADFEQFDCDLQVKDTEKVVQAKMYLGASHGSFYVHFLNIFGGTLSGALSGFAKKYIRFTTLL